MSPPLAGGAWGGGHNVNWFTKLRIIGFNDFLYSICVGCGFKIETVFKFCAVENVLAIVLIQHLHHLSHNGNKQTDHPDH